MIRSSARIGYLSNELPRLFQLQQKPFTLSLSLSRALEFNVIHPPSLTSSTPRSKSLTSFTLPIQSRNFSSQSKLHQINSAEMSSKLIPSDPDHVMVIRNVTPNIATFSVPFSRFGKVKIGGRGTLGV
jgi:hypothetical protein